MFKIRDLNKFRGCLIGGAAGDALGYAVEFLQYEDIVCKYGKNGIVEYDLTNGVAQISDDTQMTLFTSTGLLLGTTRLMTRGIMGEYQNYIALSYKDWLRTQFEKYPLSKEQHFSWLVNLKELFSQRAPGMSCICSIEMGANGTIEHPINNSKGCGGIMRAAPIGLYFNGNKIKREQVDIIGAKTAAITHGHELGYIPAAALVHIISVLAESEDVTVIEAVKNSMEMMKVLFPEAVHMKELQILVEKAIELSKQKIDDHDAITQLGEGWVAEETLAIAVYCVLKYSNDFDKALIASVNHSGDSDSTGAVTGNILGAYLGLDKIPEKYIRNLELKDIILEIADDLYNDCRISECSSYHDEIWENKYIYMTYKK